jgi:LacI family transcriptional regulator
MNLEDIAAKAGVSRSTVSRVINRASYVSEATRERVMAVIEREGFSPNPAARALVTQHHQVISVVIPQIPSVLFEDNFYFPALLQGVSSAAHEKDYAMMLWLGLPEQDDEQFYRRLEQNRLVDGAILASTPSKNLLIDRYLETNKPFVMVERPGHDYDRISYVSIDNLNASYELVTYLVKLGRQCIGHVTGNLAIADGRDRLDGYKLALSQAGLPFDKRLVVEGNFTQQSGYDGTKILIEQGVDAIVAASDIMARGVLMALHELGVQVPGDVAVVGFDDLPTALRTSPQLTTVRQPVEEKGARAARLLIDLIEGRLESPQQILLPTELVIRESCGGGQ